MRGGTIKPGVVTVSDQFQSTRPVRGGTRDNRFCAVALQISIHPPRAGRDPVRSISAANSIDFNPPAPCGAGLPLLISLNLFLQFQSTRPVRGGTFTAERAVLP